MNWLANFLTGLFTTSYFIIVRATDSFQGYRCPNMVKICKLHFKVLNHTTWPPRVLPNLLHQLSDSSAHYTSGFFPTSSYLLSLLLMPFVLKLHIYCLPSSLFCHMSDHFWLTRSYAHHHQIEATATTHFYCSVFNFTAKMTSLIRP